MQWRRLGKIFDPAEHRLHLGYGEFAQAPSVLLRGDFVRIYFSTRTRDDNGAKHRSHVAYVDMDQGLSRVTGLSSGPVLPLGALGCFDEHGIFPINVIRRKDLVYGYTCGWSRRLSVPVETAIGLAISYDNGTTFKRVGDGPILAASLNEPCLVGDAFVREINGSFHMWYIFGVGWSRSDPSGGLERTYKIGHAISADGISWVKEEGRQIIADRLGRLECQALPTVIGIDGRYHMFFCYRHSYGFRSGEANGYRLGHASSDDLIEWSRNDDQMALEPAPDGWDSEMQCYPHAFEYNGRFYLLYNGNDFGRHGFGLAVLE